MAKKLRNMKKGEREDEIFHYIEKAVIEGAKNDEIGVLHTPLEGRMKGYTKETPIILDKWKGRLAKQIAEVV
jgi:hypothetical protein